MAKGLKLAYPTHKQTGTLITGYNLDVNNENQWTR